MKVLIVDDSRAMRLIVQRTLRQAGYEGLDVEEASNGKEAYDLIRNSPPDVVLCDWNMPEMNGIDLLEKLRNEGDKTRFGFVTSEGTAEMRGRAEGAGALFLIEKPFTVERFQQCLGPILG
jgi:two-component system chemotaxis response regulator CheY